MTSSTHTTPSLTTIEAECFAEAVAAAANHRLLQRQVLSSPRGSRAASDPAVTSLVAKGLLEYAGATSRGDATYRLTAAGRLKAGLRPSTEQRLTSNWTRIDTARTRAAVANLQEFLGQDEQVLPDCYRRQDGQIAIIYSDISAHGLFAVRIEDAETADEAESYTEFCDGTTDLADEALARALLADGEKRTLKYSGASSPVLAGEPDA